MDRVERDLGPGGYVECLDMDVKSCVEDDKYRIPAWFKPGRVDAHVNDAPSFVSIDWKGYTPLDLGR